MQIILLSGGSGKRLWPLSNNTRSKQFLKLLTVDGGRESMVQRVVRQVRESGIEAQVTVATSASQKDVIVNQLGENVQIVTEPERRDTFPAIALASSYLSLEKGCSRDEIVVVMPCDPYTEAGYFETISKMAKAVEAGVADLVLMGIEPTYASSKYGYIVPVVANEASTANTNDSSSVIANESEAISSNNGIATATPLNDEESYLNDEGNSCSNKENCRNDEENSRNDEIYKVRRFTEKPTEEKAKELIAQNAFWNGGVFAFRLGYLMDIVGKYIDLKTVIANEPSAAIANEASTVNTNAYPSAIANESEAISFDEIRRRYSEFPKISFDYEVVEKAKSVAAVKYSGKWKDLGTWNTLTEELGGDSIGNVLMADTDNTHIVNELELPIMCIGTKDLVIAASPDGILVSDKKQSEKIKTYADKLQHRPMYEERRWGEYKVIDEITHTDGNKTLTKQVLVHAGKFITYQTHEHRDEVWTFVDGEGLLVIEGQEIKVTKGKTIHIAKGTKHAIKALTDLRFIEVQSGNLLLEEDTTRYPWDW